MNSIQELFSQKDYCLEEISRIRQQWGTKGFDQKQADAIRSSLGFMLFYCPKELSDAVDGMLHELDMRESWLEGGFRSELHKMKKALGLVHA